MAKKKVKKDNGFVFKSTLMGDFYIVDKKEMDRLWKKLRSLGIDTVQTVERMK